MYIMEYTKYNVLWHISNFSRDIHFFPLEDDQYIAWCAGDVFYVNWDEVLVGATAVVSTLGGFGSDEQMKRINGEANVVAVNAAKEYGEPSHWALICS